MAMTYIQSVGVAVFTSVVILFILMIYILVGRNEP